MGLAVGPGAGGGRASNEDRVIVRLVDWLKRQNEPISEELWASIVRTSRQTQDIRAAQRAQQMLADRIDPIPRAAFSDDDQRPAAITLNLGVQVNGHGHPELRAGSLTLSLGGGDRPNGRQHESP